VLLPINHAEFISAALTTFSSIEASIRMLIGRIALSPPPA
jgi:hypothetical protein